jgi:hypothetical protein
VIRRRLGLVVLAVLLAAAATGCTPQQFQAWWTSQGRPPLREPELSAMADAATRYWAEVARRNRFVFEVRPIDAALAARMTPTSWRPGCPVGLGDLRYVWVSHMGMDGTERVGELVVHRDTVAALAGVFRHIWDEAFPVERMRLVDDYGGDDDASMAANNTSAFNCRRVAGTTRWSEHAFGRAIDINPVQNPYVRGGRVDPPAGRAYVDRGHVRAGMLVAGGPVVGAFRFVGWGWGGDWSSGKDYQHVSAGGR